MNMQILKEHKVKYLNRRIAEIEELKKSLEAEDFTLAVTIGHRLKGNGETFGFPAISSIGIAMEGAGVTKDKEKLRAIINDLNSVVEENLVGILNH